MFGEIPQEDLKDAAEEAIRRLADGESHLAIHPNCGTNFVTMGVAAGLASWLGMLGAKKDLRDRLDRLSLVITLSTLAVIAAQPLGPKVQRSVTTSAKLGTLQIDRIEKIPRGAHPVFRIHTKSI